MRGNGGPPSSFSICSIGRSCGRRPSRGDAMSEHVTDPGVALGRWRHDMKNQLGIILGFADLLLQEMDPADSRRADIQEMHTAATRAMELLAALPVSNEGSKT